MKLAYFRGVLLSAIVFASQGDATAILGQSRNSTPAAMTVESQQALINRYCSGCHNDKVKSGGFSWTSVDLAHPEQSAQQVEKVLPRDNNGPMRQRWTALSPRLKTKLMRLLRRVPARKRRSSIA